MPLDNKAPSGVLLLDKPEGITSQRAVSKVKHLCGAKVGHTGTLDPMATGLLPLLIGSATRLSTMLLEGDKGYRAEMLFGITTDTLDTTGKELSRTTPNISREAFEAACMKYKGDITQIPPMYSAVSIGGQRMYDLARRGIEVEREGRAVSIHSLDIIEFNEGGATIEVVCSKGTYIRTLIDDIGRDLGCGAVMSALRRTMSAGYNLADAIALEELSSENVAGRIIPSESLFEDLEIITPDEFYINLMLNGQWVEGRKIKASGPRHRLYGKDGFIGVLEARGSTYGFMWRI